VCQVTATDWDAGDNGRVYYSIPGSVASIFHVDQRGVISAHEAIDREVYEVFSFPVLAVDSAATSRRTGSALVKITVDDVNDERPVFLQPTYLFTVKENEPAATQVRLCRRGHGHREFPFESRKVPHKVKTFSITPVVTKSLYSHQIKPK